MTHSEKQAKLITAKRPSLAERICEYIHGSNIQQFATLTDALLAEIFNVPRGKLCKRFEKKLQKPLETFLWEQRLFYVSIKIAKRECNADDLPELSQQLGFPGYMDFGERFYKWLGIDPQRYVKIMAENAANRQDQKENTDDQSEHDPHILPAI